MDRRYRVHRLRVGGRGRRTIWGLAESRACLRPRAPIRRGRRGALVRDPIGLAFALPASLAGVLTASLFVGALLPVLGSPREEQSVIGFSFSALVLVVCAATSVVIVRALIRRA